MGISGHFTNPFNWISGDESTIIDSYENKITHLENPSYKSVVNHPLKLDAVVSIKCDYFSDDFSGLSLIMSKSFLEDSFSNLQVSLQKSIGKAVDPLSQFAAFVRSGY